MRNPGVLYVQMASMFNRAIQSVVRGEGVENASLRENASSFKAEAARAEIFDHC